MSTNKILIGVLVVLIPIAVLGSFTLGKVRQAKPAVSAYDTLVEGPAAVLTQDPLNPNSKAEVVIDAPAEARIGQLVRFDLSKSSGTQFKWKSIPTNTNFEIFDGGKKACFSAEVDGVYTFVVACALNNTVDVKTHTIKVGSNPAPAPNPEPAPSPNGTLSAKVKIWAGAVTTGTRKAEALKLAAGLDSVSAMIAAGTLTTPEDIVGKTAETNRTALGTQISAWVPFLTNVQAEMKQRAAAGELTTPEQHSAMWQEISKALKEFGNA
jgi:hypothetical protein